MCVEDHEIIDESRWRHRVFTTRSNFGSVALQTLFSESKLQLLRRRLQDVAVRREEMLNERCVCILHERVVLNGVLVHACAM